jgi:hypothetical protein
MHHRAVRHRHLASAYCLPDRWTIDVQGDSRRIRHHHPASQYVCKPQSRGIVNNRHLGDFHPPLLLHTISTQLYSDYQQNNTKTPPLSPT